MENTRLKCKRKERGLTQAQVAEKIGVSTVGYQRYESGGRVPNAPTSILIADTLGVTTYEEFKALFGEATPDNAKPPDKNRAKSTKT